MMGEEEGEEEGGGGDLKPSSIYLYGRQKARD